MFLFEFLPLLVSLAGLAIPLLEGDSKEMVLVRVGCYLSWTVNNVEVLVNEHSVALDIVQGFPDHWLGEEALVRH